MYLFSIADIPDKFHKNGIQVIMIDNEIRDAYENSSGYPFLFLDSTLVGCAAIISPIETSNETLKFGIIRSAAESLAILIQCSQASMELPEVHHQSRLPIITISSVFDSEVADLFFIALING